MSDSRRRCLHLACGRKPFASTADEHWLNVDLLPLPGVDQQVDLCAYPWPWPDESFDHIYSSSFLEHVPHETRISRQPTARWPGTLAAFAARWQELRRLDGFFALFAEIWRALAPGGTTEHHVPWPLSLESISDPTHVRFITTQTLAYLCNTETITQDYLLPLAFTVDLPYRFAADISYEGREAEALAVCRQQWGAVHYWRFTLRKIPIPAPPPPGPPTPLPRPTDDALQLIPLGLLVAAETRGHQG